jgi:integrase
VNRREWAVGDGTMNSLAPWPPRRPCAATRASAIRLELHRLTTEAGVGWRFPPHQLRHGHALEFAREGVALSIIERQLGHATSIYLHGDEIIAAAHNRRGPMISATAGLRH